MQIEQWFFIVNLRAGSGRNLNKWTQLKNALDKTALQYTFEFTQYKMHAIVLVEQAVAQGYRAFVVVGGDGSINEVVNGLMLQKTLDIQECVLSAMPWGTGNDWAAYYKLPHKIAAFIAMLQQPIYKKHDLGCVTYTHEGQEKKHYFINFAGAGFDSYMLQKMGTGEGSRLRYYKYVLRCLKSYVSPQFHLGIQGKRVALHSLLLLVCIGKFGGAGMKFAPSAQADDGMFNVLSVGDMSFLKRLMSLVKLMDGKINQHPKVEIWETAQVSLDADSPLAFQCDGEVIAALPASIDCLQQYLNIVVDRY